jgi:leucyl aminopeptidase
MYDKSIFIKEHLMFIRARKLKTENIKETIVVGCFDRGINDISFLDQALSGYLRKSLKSGILSSTLGEINKIQPTSKLATPEIIVVGLGEKKKTENEYRELFQTLSKTLSRDVYIYIDTFVSRTFKASQIASFFAEEFVLARYKFDQLKSKPKPRVEFDVYYYSQDNVESEINEAVIISTAANNTKTLVNLPHNYLNSVHLAEYAVSLAKRLKLSYKVYEKPEIEALGMTAFLAVNQGSSVPPKLIVIKYQGKDKWEDPLALVGKGLTFDTGGYNLKPNSKNMKSDMGGAATVLGALEAAATLKLKENIVLIIASTDNMVSAEAYVPDDVITAANGKTIEIFSTDAEGRLTLADALWFAQTKEQSSRIIDYATLTGAVIVALGKYTGVFSNSRSMVNQFLQAAVQANELAWELPIGPFFKKSIQGKVADIDNAGTRNGGASAAAAFLEEFIEPTTKWVHCDIAGSATDGDNFGTGAMVRSTIQFIRSSEKGR